MAKINQLITRWPKGTIFTSSYLKKEGFTSDFVSRYKMNDVLKSVGHGAYKLYGDKVDWFGALYALQSQLNLSIHAKIFLYGLRGERLPKWFKSNDWDVSINYKTTNLFSSGQLENLSEYCHKEFTIKISSLELGAMEMLYHIPKKQGFDEALLIMQNLVSLRPELVQRLLEQCRSIKVKRLFMHMAEKMEHTWVKQLDLTRIDFGSGKRVTAEHGVLDKQYDITVPE